MSHSRADTKHLGLKHVTSSQRLHNSRKLSPWGSHPDQQRAERKDGRPPVKLPRGLAQSLVVLVIGHA